MVIYGVYGEDINFKSVPGLGNQNSGFRSGWARCALTSSLSGTGIHAQSYPFAAGAQTSAWLSFQLRYNNFQSQNWAAGFSLFGTTTYVGIGTDTSNSGKLALVKWNGSTRTQLAAEGGATIATASSVYRIDMQMTSFGASATVNVYINNVSVISFTGDVTLSGMSNFDCVALMTPSNGGGYGPYLSEIIVADSDTRSIQGVQTLALTGAGTTNNWTSNTYTNINAITYTDSTPTYVNTTGTDQQYNVTDPTPASFATVAVNISARMAKGLTSTPTQVKLGYNSGGTVGFGTGAAKTLATYYQTFDQLDYVNPVTGVAFTQSEITALQLDMQSA